MSHWDTYKRVYFGAIIFVGANAEAVDLVFGSLTGEQLQALSRRMIFIMACKCVAVAATNLGVYLGISQKPANP